MNGNKRSFIAILNNRIRTMIWQFQRSLMRTNTDKHMRSKKETPTKQKKSVSNDADRVS